MSILEDEIELGAGKVTIDHFSRIYWAMVKGLQVDRIIRLLLRIARALFRE